jgi:hypothetical protein
MAKYIVHAKSELPDLVHMRIINWDSMPYFQLVDSRDNDMWAPGNAIEHAQIIDVNGHEIPVDAGVRGLPTFQVRSNVHIKEFVLVWV